MAKRFPGSAVFFDLLHCVECKFDIFLQQNCFLTYLQPRNISYKQTSRPAEEWVCTKKTYLKLSIRFNTVNKIKQLPSSNKDPNLDFKEMYIRTIMSLWKILYRTNWMEQTRIPQSKKFTSDEADQMSSETSRSRILRPRHYQATFSSSLDNSRESLHSLMNHFNTF